MLSLRDPIHGFIRAAPLEAALINSRPLQRLRTKLESLQKEVAAWESTTTGADFPEGE